MTVPSPYFNPHVQVSMQIGSDMQRLAKQRDELRKQREALDLNIDEAKLKRLTTVVMELTERRDEIHADWWEVVQKLDQMRQVQHDVTQTAMKA